jgi:hypothetical protein
MVEEENRLRNDRIAWLNTIQGLLFAALGFAWKDGKQLIPVLACLGLLVALSSWLGLIISHKALKKLRTNWTRWNKDPSHDPQSPGASPGIFGYWAPMSWGWLAPWFTLPVLFMGAWGSILFLHLSSRASAPAKTVCLTVKGERVEVTGGTLTIRPGTTVGTCP